jgi:hypothetical protein
MPRNYIDSARVTAIVISASIDIKNRRSKTKQSQNNTIPFIVGLRARQRIRNVDRHIQFARSSVGENETHECGAVAATWNYTDIRTTEREAAMRTNRSVEARLLHNLCENANGEIIGIAKNDFEPL